MELQNLLSGASFLALQNARMNAHFAAALKRDAREKQGRICPRETRETTRSIFADGQQARPQKRSRVRMTRSTGSITVAVRVGTYTTCVCKHKV